VPPDPLRLLTDELGSETLRGEFGALAEAEAEAQGRRANG
jgi:hypothetical protein